MKQKAFSIAFKGQSFGEKKIDKRQQTQALTMVTYTGNY